MKSYQPRTYVIILILIVSTIIVIEYQKKGEKTQETPIKDINKVEIAVICPRGDELQQYMFLAEMAEQDINEYMIEQNDPHEFVFTVTSADGNSMTAFNIAKQNYEAGNKLIVGLSWSSQLDTFFSFAHEKDCLIVSPGSTQPWPWRLAPNTYRLYPADHLYTVPLVRSIESLNISKVVIVQLKTGFADIMYDEFVNEYTGMFDVIIIEAEGSEEDISCSTQLLENAISDSLIEYGEEHVAVYFIGFSEQLANILNSAPSDNVYSVPWFVWNWYNWYQDQGTRYSQFEEDKTQLARIQLIGVHPAIPNNPTYHRVNEAYQEVFNQPISMIHGNVYDGLWITALSVAETDSVDGTIVGLKIPDVSKKYIGVTGNCTFNEWGDRWGVDWAIYGYELIEKQVIVTEYGFYNNTIGETSWYNK